MSEFTHGAINGVRSDAVNASTVELTVAGRLDQAVVPRVGPMFDRALEQRPARIVLDVTDCHYADAAGIGLLLDLHRRSRRAGGRLELRAPSARLRRLFEIARVDQVFQIESDARTPDPDPVRVIGTARPPG
ncbi:STAS domain-containing protein [Plantactinospora sp. B24E8]|uniref:STAS domain-containing protein n=1 Tax=Plantactinospora sp. B24E8 TaxID=3153567 RepID=UPI00325F36C1